MANTGTQKAPKKFTFKMQNKLLFIFVSITLLFAALICRLIYLNNADGERYEKQVLSRQSYVSSVIPFKRGDILDRNGTVLAKSELKYRLVVDPKKLLSEKEENYNKTLQSIETHFGVSVSELEEKIKAKENSQYLVIKKYLGYSTVQEFKSKMEEDELITGVYFEQEYVRNYPYATLACDLLGFSNSENKGFYGIEEYYNNILNGTNGREYGYYDSELNIERIVKKASNGNSIISTIDANIQRIVQNNINEFNATTGSKNIGIIVMNPNNGEIYAMASNEEYDLNNPRDLSVLFTEEEIATLTEEEKTKALNELWQNYCITSGYEPGSTFKPFTVATALEEDFVYDDETFVCDGYEHYGSRINCVNRSGHGVITLAQAIMKSCNDALMQIAMREGKDIFTKYQARFNIGSKTGIDLPGEAMGIIINSSKMGMTDLATNSFGQNFNTTMIQMAAGFSSIVNGGYYYEPHVVKSIINEDGTTVSENTGNVVRQTISSSTSDLLKKYLYWTVEEGTAKTAQVEGYTVGGKTGTAQKYPRGNGKYLVSFIGCVPALNPEVVIYVVIDEAQNVDRQDNSSLATKLASKVLKEILPHLSVYPEGEIDYLLDELKELEHSHDTEGGDNTTPDTPNTNQGNETQTGEGTTNSNTPSTEGQTNQGGDTTNNHEGQTSSNPDQSTTPGEQTGSSETQGEDGANTQNNNTSTEFNGEALPSDETVNPAIASSYNQDNQETGETTGNTTQ